VGERGRANLTSAPSLIHSRTMDVAVLGGGAWGTVLAALAADHGHAVALWEVDGPAARQLLGRRTNARSVDGFRLPESVAVTTELEEAVRGRGLVVGAGASEAGRAALAAARPARGGGAGGGGRAAGGA